MKRACLASFVFLFALFSAGADDEASNTATVRVNRFGNCYAKSVPSEPYGSKGTTKVYAVRSGDDVLLHTFAWYSSEFYLECNVGQPNQQVGVSIIQFGPWARGRQANRNDMALAFYFSGKLVRKYSTLDIAGSPNNVASSVSHYTVIQRVDGYRWQQSNYYTFEVLTSDRRLLVFDPTTGKTLSAQEPAK